MTGCGVVELTKYPLSISDKHEYDDRRCLIPIVISPSFC